MRDHGGVERVVALDAAVIAHPPCTAPAPVGGGERGDRGRLSRADLHDEPAAGGEHARHLAHQPADGREPVGAAG